MAIKAAYQRAVWNLATETLSAAGWGDFRELPNFPDHGPPDAKLEFLDNYLQQALAPQDIRPNPRLRHEHIRGDLNKYRPWLLHVVLRHLHETHIEHIKSSIQLPEDFKKVIEDLHLFHKSPRKVAEITGDIRKGTIQHYRTLDDFRRTMDLLRPPPSPLKPEERDRAFRQHLREYGGDGGATLIATLNNGTMVIQLNTEEASLALGSPHWCTAYRNEKTRFDSYKDNLIMILAPDGRRHQLHFRKSQFMDANDNPVSLIETLSHNKGLEEALSPVLRRALEESPISPMAHRSYLEMCEGIPAFEDEIIHARLAQKTLEDVIETGQAHFISGIIHHCLKSQRVAESLANPEGICQTLNIATHANNGSVFKILEAASKTRLLTEALTGPEGIPSALKIIADRVPGKISHEDYLNFRKACQDNPDFLKAFISPEGFPRLISEAEQSGNKTKLRSLKDEYRNLKEMAAANQTCPTSGTRSAAACQPAHAPRSMA